MNIKHITQLGLYLFALLNFSTTCFSSSGDYNNKNPASLGKVYQLIDEAIAQGGATYTAGDGIAINNSNVISATPFLSVGDFYQGGVVFYVDSTGQHGLAISLFEEAASPFTSASTVPQADGYGIGAGAPNTSVIAAYYGAIGTVNSIPQRLMGYNVLQDGISPCLPELSTNPTLPCYAGWYLGSITEYQLVFENFTTIDDAIFNNGGKRLSTSSYWTSTTLNASSQAYIINISTGVPGTSSLSTDNGLRAIRQF